MRNTSEQKKWQRNGKGYAKTDIRFWMGVLFKPKYTDADRRIEAKNWSVRIQYQGNRRAFSLGTPNQAAAAARAKDIYLHLHANGWERTIARYRPELVAKKKQDATIGEFFSEVKAKADGNPKTIEGYCKSFRKIAADIMDIENTPKKFDYRSGGHQRWLEQVHSIPLATIGPNMVQAWKRSFLAKAGNDPVASRQAKVSVNFFLRQARNLFSPDVLRHLDIELPNPLPFTGIQFEPRQSLKYRSEFDIKKLIQTAKDSLSEHQPELFKIFLLAVMAGLRRKEIDLLEWGAFQWQHSCIRIEATRWFQPKSEDSIGDVQVDPEVLEIFRGYRARAIGGFVIESTRRPRLGVTYQYYRCQELFERLTIWLRENGVKDNKPLHVLRKEYGSQICAIHGIHAASRALRHADIRVTNEYYTDSRVRVTPEMGHLLKADSDVTAAVKPKLLSPAAK